MGLRQSRRRRRHATQARSEFDWQVERGLGEPWPARFRPLPSEAQHPSMMARWHAAALQTCTRGTRRVCLLAGCTPVPDSGRLFFKLRAETLLAMRAYSSAVLPALLLVLLSSSGCQALTIQEAFSDPAYKPLIDKASAVVSLGLCLCLQLNASGSTPTPCSSLLAADNPDPPVHSGGRAAWGV